MISDEESVKMKVSVQNQKSGRSYGEYNVTSSTTVLNLKQQISRQAKASLGAERQRLYLSKGDNKNEVLQDDQPLSAYKITDGSVIYIRDLGPQIGWRTVFLVEYAGPLFIYLFFYIQPYLIYGSTPPSSDPVATASVQKIAFYAWMAHFVKRELETLFVHQFSKGTMPLRNIFKNCAYYWSFAFLVGYYINRPDFSPPATPIVYLSLIAYILCELGNLNCHIILKNLRRPGTRDRKIPRGFLFELVSCPNYTFEIAAWLSFTVMTWSFAPLLFALVGAGQMTVWAMDKHRAYRREFSDYPRRKIIFPYVF